jgi:hypothetical protein
LCTTGDPQPKAFIDRNGHRKGFRDHNLVEDPGTTAENENTHKTVILRIQIFQRSEDDDPEKNVGIV